MTDLIDRPIRDQAAALRNGGTTTIELIEATLARVGHRNPSLDAFVHLDTDGARNAARRIDEALQRGDDPGPLARPMPRWSLMRSRAATRRRDWAGPSPECA